MSYLYYSRLFPDCPVAVELNGRSFLLHGLTIPHSVKPTFAAGGIVWLHSASLHYGPRSRTGSCRHGRNALHWLSQRLNKDLM